MSSCSNHSNRIITSLIAPKVDLPEIKGKHKKFRTLVTSYIGNQEIMKSFVD